MYVLSSACMDCARKTREYFDRRCVSDIMTQHMLRALESDKPRVRRKRG